MREGLFAKSYWLPGGRNQLDVFSMTPREVARAQNTRHSTHGKIN